MAEDELEEGEEKKSSKKIIIIAAIVLLLAGGGAGYYFMAGNTSPADGEQAEEEQIEEEVAVETIYHVIEKPFTVNFPKGSDARLIQVSVTLLVEGEETVEALKKHTPMIQNNLLMTISSKGSDDLMTREGKETLRSDMLKEVGSIMEKMTGKNKVTNLFFTTFVMQ